MKKITLLLLSISLLTSCGKNKGEQMLYDYQQKNAKTLNFDLNDLDFNIQKVEKVADITAADSLKYIKQEFTSLWGKDLEKSVADTLSFKYVKDFIQGRIAFNDTMVKLYQEGVIAAIKYDDYSSRMKSEEKRNKAIDTKHDFKDLLAEVERIELKYNELSMNLDSLLTTKYRAVYTMNNPMLNNAKQTFDEFYYTNPAQTEFIKKEATEEK